MTLEDIRNEQVMAGIISQRNIMILNQSAELIKAHEQITALERENAELKAKKE